MITEIIISTLIYILRAVNIHLVLYTLTDRGRSNKLSIALTAVYAAYPAAEALLELPDAVFFLTLVLLYLATLSAHRKEPLKAIYVMLLYIFTDSIVTPLVLMTLSFFLTAGPVMRETVYLVLNAAFFAVIWKILPRRADEIKLSLSLITTRVYGLILVYTSILAFLVSFANTAPTLNIGKDTIFFSLKLFLMPTALLSLFIIINMIVNGITKMYYQESSRLLDKQIGLYSPLF